MPPLPLFPRFFYQPNDHAPVRLYVVARPFPLQYETLHMNHRPYSNSTVAPPLAARL